MNSDPRPTPWILRLHFQILGAMLLGIGLGLVPGDTVVGAVGWMGTLFVRLLRMVIVPLILTSIVSGVASVGGGRSLGRLGLKTISYYLATSLLAILVGLVLVNLIAPGRDADLGSALQQEVPQLETPGSLAEIFLRMVPTNPIAAMAEGDMLAIIFFAIVLGVGLTRLPETPRTRLTELFGWAFELMMVVTAGVIRLAPLGVLGLITVAVHSSGLNAFAALGRYAMTITLGLTIHLFVTLPLLLWVLGRMSPLIHFRNMSDAMLMAFSTSSSSATLPVTLRCVETRSLVSNRVSSFVLPMGATVNMDGTALYECVGVIFIVTEAVNLTGPQVSLIVGAMLAIDRPLDMMRTMVNVFSDSCGAAIIARSEGEADVNRTAA